MSTEPQPPRPEADAVGLPAPAQKPRVLQDGRDMFWSIAPLVLACIALAGLLGMCSFAPGGSEAGPAPSYDAPAALHADAKVLDIPIRLPQLPAEWHSNSGRRDGIEAGRTDPVSGQQVRAVTSIVGYLAPSGMYVSLRQSDADEAQLVESINTGLYPTGVQHVDGVTWVVYESAEDTEPVWTTRLEGPTGPAQLAITGAADVDEFRTLAASTQNQPPLPAG